MKLSLITSFVLGAFSATVFAGRTFEYKTLDYDYAFDENDEEVRNMIMMIPDGTGPNVFTMARTVLDPTMKSRLHIDPLLMGTVQTHSTTSYVPDSASTATAYSTGFKTYDAAIAVDHYGQPIGTVLEAAKARGMVTGLIVTSRVTHATPASFASHVKDRNMEIDIASQYVYGGHLDFVLGGGARNFNETMVADLKSDGYAVVSNYAELAAYQKANKDSGNLRLFGLFKKSHMSYEVDRLRELEANPDSDAREPSLSEMVDMVLSIMKNNPQAKKHGFFMMIEGSRVDHAGHSNDPGSVAKEAIAFDETVGVVKDFVNNVKNTAMISAADHGTGGMTLGRVDKYEWRPSELQEQHMSTEWMTDDILEPLLKTCDTSHGCICEEMLLGKCQELLTQYSKAPELTEEQTASLKKTIAEAVKSGDLYDLMIELGHIISDSARIGWTTVGHVGTDVNLYCMGPSILERMCKGVHQNTYVNKIMTKYLHLDTAVDAETLKLRGYKALEGVMEPREEE